MVLRRRCRFFFDLVVWVFWRERERRGVEEKERRVASLIGLQALSLRASGGETKRCPLLRKDFSTRSSFAFLRDPRMEPEGAGASRIDGKGRRERESCESIAS